jgi:hypothetical protein
MGMSFGGAVTLDLMAVAPHAVGAAALIVPISVHPGEPVAPAASVHPS